MNNNNSGHHQRHRGRGGHSHKYRSGGTSSGSDSQSLDRQKKHALAQKEKFSNMARDAQSNGDRVEAEYYFQHVEHYTRVLAEIQDREQPRHEPRGDHQQQADRQAAPTEQNMPQPEENANEAEPASAPVDAEDDDAPKPRARTTGRGRPRRAAPSNMDDNAEVIPLPSSILGEPAAADVTDEA